MPKASKPPRSPAGDGHARQAHGVDEDVRSGNVARLKRIEGQVRGLQKMVEEGRYCADILTQISSVQEALRAVSRELLRNHLKHCAAHELTKGGPASRGAHCYIGLEWVETVDDDGVQLSCAAEDVRRMQAPQPSAD